MECYQGIDDGEVFWALSRGLAPDAVFLTTDAFLPEEEIRRMTYPDVTDDRIFGYLTRLEHG